MRKTSLQLLVIALIFILTTYISRAEAPPLDFREEVIVKIIRTQDNAQSKEINNVIELLRANLSDDNGFSTEIVDNVKVDTRQYLIKNSFVHHVLANILSNDANRIRASLYTQGISNSRQFEAGSVSKLANQIRSYLESKDAILERIQISQSSENKFSKHMNQGLIYLLKTNEIAKAIEEFKLAEYINPKSAIPHFNLALCYKRIGDYEKRKEHVEKGLSLESQNHALKNELALIYMAEDNFYKAIEVLEGLPENNPTFQWNLAYAYSQIDQPEKSKEFLHSIIEIDANPSIALIADKRLRELEKKEKSLTKTKKALGIAFIGLVIVLIIALIAIVVKRIKKEANGSKNLKPEDLLTFKIQIGVAIVSGLFSVLTVTLPKLLGG